MSCSILQTTSPIVVTANIQRWTICSDDIYLLKFSEAPPQWMEDMFNNMLDDTGLPDEVSDLEDRFSNFYEGYVEHFYDWKDGDTETLAYVQNIYTTNTVFNAGIQDIRIAYVSKDESGALFDQLIGTWQTGAGGAWFNNQVSVVSNVAYSAAKSASTLTASISSQQDQLDAIVGDIDSLEKQVDGKVETFIGEHDVVTPQGALLPDAEPYATWLADGTRDEHTGDTYVKTVEDVYGNDQIESIWAFTKDSDTGEYNWTAVTNTLAAEAYQQALDAGVLADGKINSYYQATPPTSVEDPTLGDGDIWIDSDDENKMYRYDETLGWLEVRDTAITASVDRLDEATVDINGIATAKSALVVNADGNISGYVASASNDPDYAGSLFKIYADRFFIGSSADQAFGTAPFSIDTTQTPDQIKFNGIVEFENIEGGENVLTVGEAAGDINNHTTTIDGGKITTGSVNANRLATNTLWASGMIASPEFWTNYTGYVGSGNPAGAFVNMGAGIGSYNYPNIYGNYIRGGEMYATHLEAVRIDAAEIYGGYIYGSTIEAGNLIAPSINGLRVKVGFFYSTIDGAQDINITVNEGLAIDNQGNITRFGAASDVFPRGIASVSISYVGPNYSDDIMTYPFIKDRDTITFNRIDEDISGTAWFSYVAYGY